LIWLIMLICRKGDRKRLKEVVMKVFLRGDKKMLRCRMLLVGFLVFCSTANCVAAGGSSQNLVWPKLLEAANLKILWENKLPMKAAENLERLFIIGNRIYALSDHNYMVCLNREKGNVIFSRPIADAGLPVVGLELYKDELFSIVGNKLVEINPEFGTERSARRLEFGVVCPAARNSLHFYIAGSDRRMHVLRAEDKIKLFEAAAKDDSMISSIVADEDFVVFATDSGGVVSILADKPKQLWSFYAAEAVCGPVVRDGESLFFASRDTNVYKVNILTGELVWKYQTAAVLERSPRVGKGGVYQYVRGQGLAALDKETGELIWELAKGADLLAEADGKAYVITNTGKLVVMDNNNGKQRYAVNFAGVSRYASNVADSKIYIADESGRLACLEPVE